MKTALELAVYSVKTYRGCYWTDLAGEGFHCEERGRVTGLQSCCEPVRGPPTKKNNKKSTKTIMNICTHVIT